VCRVRWHAPCELPRNAARLPTPARGVTPPQRDPPTAAIDSGALAPPPSGRQVQFEARLSVPARGPPLLNSLPETLAARSVAHLCPSLAAGAGLPDSVARPVRTFAECCTAADLCTGRDTAAMSSARRCHRLRRAGSAPLRSSRSVRSQAASSRARAASAQLVARDAGCSKLRASVSVTCGERRSAEIGGAPRANLRRMLHCCRPLHRA